MKTFRLFASSTFNDFRQERDILQTDVFPELSKLCSENGFGFMPIDLRWGVTPGAQYDQKTLDLCLGEVRACTVEPHPDFLILSGDRYGWVPLPYMIDQKEFEEIIEHILDTDKTLIEQWYKLDLNQIPPAYILQKREGIYEVYENWDTVEKSLREIFQKTVLQTSLSEKTKEKYFTSATEFEYEEFLKRVNDAEESLFLVSRTIDVNGQNNDLFAADNNRQIDFKKRLENGIPAQNKIPLHAVLQFKNRFNDEYLKTFAQKLIQMLSVSIQAEIDRLKPMEAQSEQEFHKAHMLELSESVIGRDREIADILRYIDDTKAKLPLILTGPSGIGKSAVMAKAINDALYKVDRQIVYRFCGITEKSSSMQSLMVSLLGDIGSTIDISHDTDDVKELSSWSEPKRDRVAEAINDALFSIHQPTVIFIDALDQMGDRNKLEWLPSVLPDNLKIVFSVLNDEKYQDDSYYFEKLISLYPTNAFQPLEYLDNLSTAEKIITETLKQYNRKLQPHQMEYVLRQYAKVNTPFYLKIVCEEIRHWGSEKNEEDLSLSDSQSGIACEYIENLHKLYHHDEELVRRVFGYIFAARESMTEAQLYEILSNDRELVKRFEHVDHTNHGDMLPMAVWARLKSHIDSFVREGENGNLQFFHREFRNGARQFYSYELSQRLLSIFEKMLENNDYFSMRENIVQLHIYTLTNQKKEIPNNPIEQQKAFILDLSEKNKKIVENYFNFLYQNRRKFSKLSDIVWLIAYDEIAQILTDSLYSHCQELWVDFYAISLKNLASSYQDVKKEHEAEKLYKKAVLVLKSFYDKSSSKWGKKYCSALDDLGVLYLELNRANKAIELYEELFSMQQTLEANVFVSVLSHLASSYRLLYQFNKSIEVEEQLCFKYLPQYYAENQHYWAKHYITSLNNLSLSYQEIDRKDEAVQLVKKAHLLAEIFFKEQPEQYIDLFITCSNNLAGCYEKLDLINNAVMVYEDTLTLVKYFYNKNQLFFDTYYALLMNNLSHVYWILNRTKEAIKICKEAIEILSSRYLQNPQKSTLYYIAFRINLADYYRSIDYTEEAIEILVNVHFIIKPLYVKNKNIYFKHYMRGLISLSNAYLDNDNNDVARLYSEESCKILESFYCSDSHIFVRDYIESMNNLAISLYRLGEKNYALTIFSTAYELCLKHYSEDDSLFLDIKNKYGYIYNELNGMQYGF
jgi:hypothetical protein